MARVSLLVLGVLLLSADANCALCDPVVRGVALCRQPPPGKEEAYSVSANLVLVSAPGGDPVPLFSKTPPAQRPTEGYFDAWLLAGGQSALLNLSCEYRHRGGNKDGYLLVVRPATGKLSVICDDVAREPVVVSPNRNAVLFRLARTEQLRVWHTDGRRVSVKLPQGWYYDGADWSSNMPHCHLTLEDAHGKTRGFWLDEGRGTVAPIPPGDPWTKALDVCNGRYLSVDGSWNLWLNGPGKRRVKLAKLEAEGEPPQEAWCRFSPDGKYAICTTGRSEGEPHIAWAGQSYYFDFRGAKPAQLPQPKDSGTWIGDGDFLVWGKTESGILHTSVWDLMWTPLPSLLTHRIYKLPDRCQFEDFVRRDEPAPRGKRKR